MANDLCHSRECEPLYRSKEQRAAVIDQIHEEFQKVAAERPFAELRFTSAEEQQLYFEQLCAMDEEAFQKLWENSEVYTRLKKIQERLLEG